jgi:hypothetical protein
MNTHDDHQASILSRHGFRINGHADLPKLAYSTLSDDEIVTVMRDLALGLDPCVDLAGHMLTEEEWLSRRRGRRLARVVDAARRHRRKKQKRRCRHR